MQFFADFRALYALADLKFSVHYLRIYIIQTLLIIHIVIDFTAKVVFTSYANLHRLLADADQQLSKKDKEQTPLILDSHIIGASFIKKQSNSQSKM